MKYISHLLVILTIFLTSPSIGYTTEQRLLHVFNDGEDTSSNAITIIAKGDQRNNIIRWLSGVAATEKGRATLQAIIDSGHQLTIKHSLEARQSAGRTIAPMTSNLINKKGESVTIIMDATMLDEGTHRVFDAEFQTIPFSALHNFYHELAHAMHKMQGTWRYFNSEQQAIEEENIFRQQLAILRGEHIEHRYGKSGVPIESTRVARTH